MTKSPKFVTATCACGSKFQREVKRGRPQVWCPKCQAVPFYERTQAKATPVTETGEPVEPKADWRKLRPFDSYGANRDEIEAQVAAIYVDYRAHCQVLKTQAQVEGTSIYTIDFDGSFGLGDKIKAVYAQFKSVKADGFQTEDVAE